MNDLFSIHQVCTSCGLSRATLLRLEKRGLLTPAHVDEQTGYRWYDNHNVSRIMQIKRFTEMDMSYDDITLYYNSNGTSSELLDRIEEKFLTLKRAYEEIKLRTESDPQTSFEFITLPTCVCYAKECRGVTAQDSYWALYNTYREAIERGYRLLASEPLFLVHKRTDYLEGAFVDQEVDFTCCVPLDPSCAPSEAVVYPGCHAFSGLFHGDYSNRARAFNEMGQKVRELGLKPADHMRMLGLVAPYVGREISPANYVSRLVIPIEEDAQA